MATRRALIGGLLALVLCTGPVLAADKIEGKLKTVDTTKGTLTLTVDSRDQAFTVADDTIIQVEDVRSYVLDKGTVKERLEAPIFREAVKKRFSVTVVTAQKDGKEVVEKVVVYTGRRI